MAASRGGGTVTGVDPEAVRLVVVATPPQALAGVIFESLQRFPNATVTDVGSVKGVILAALRATGVDLARYCGSAGCRELRSLPLSSTDYAPSVEGGLPLVAVPASVGTDRHQFPQFAPVSTGPGE